MVAGPNSPSRATDARNASGSESAASSPKVLAASLTLSPNPAVPNQSISITGSGFTLGNVPYGMGPNGVHQITGTGTSFITVGGKPIVAPNVTYPIDLDSSGNMFATFILPVDTTVLAATSLTVKVIDQQGLAASATLRLVRREITLDQNTSIRGSVVAATGQGFPASNPQGTGNFPIRIDYAGENVVIATPTVSGTFEAIFTVPVTSGIPSTNIVTATTSALEATASTNHMVPSPTLTPSPAQAPAGSTIRLVGLNFPTFTQVSNLTIGNLPVLPIPAPTTSREGNFSASFLVPDIDVGSWNLIAIVGGITGFTSFNITEPEATSTPTPTPSSEPATGAVEVSEAFAEAIAADPGLQVWGFPQGRWHLYIAALPPNHPANDLVSVVPGDGVWIFNSTNRTITAPILGRALILRPGWNLKGL